MIESILASAQVSSDLTLINALLTILISIRTRCDYQFHLYENSTHV